MKNSGPREALTLEKFMEDVPCEREPMLEQRKDVRSPPLEEEGVQRQHVRNWPQIPVCIHLYCSWEEVGKI